MSSLSRHRRDESGYRLIDFGDGRKLESFAGRIVDRPSPAAQGTPRHSPDVWDSADSVFRSDRKHWTHHSKWPPQLTMDCGGFQMPIQPTPFGHLGVFPEQVMNWRWLLETAPKPDLPDGELPSGLNLFGYTGASSIAMAKSGMKVAHVDAAKPNVSAAKQAAILNGLQQHPIRYLVDDAAKFASRELRRGNRYHTVVMDPPAYGHSPSGKAWRLERDLWPLLKICLTLLQPNRCRLLVTGHSPQVGPKDVVDYLVDQIPIASGIDREQVIDRIRSGRLSLTDDSGRSLDAGFFVRFDLKGSPA